MERSISVRISDYRITRFQFARDRVIGDSQVRADEANIAALELLDEQGNSGLGFVQVLFNTIPALPEINRVFEADYLCSGPRAERSTVRRTDERSTSSTKGTMSVPGSSGGMR